MVDGRSGDGQPRRILPTAGPRRNRGDTGPWPPALRRPHTDRGDRVRRLDLTEAIRQDRGRHRRQRPGGVLRRRERVEDEDFGLRSVLSRRHGGRGAPRRLCRRPSLGRSGLRVHGDHGSGPGRSRPRRRSGDRHRGTYRSFHPRVPVHAANFTSVPATMRDAIQGAIIIAAVAYSGVVFAKKRKRPTTSATDPTDPAGSTEPRDPSTTSAGASSPIQLTGGDDAARK